MKKSFNVIVGNVAFCFDEDAVLLIENFLDRAGAYYGNDTSKLEDLERTLADELRACVGEGGIVSLAIIKAVIEKYDIEENKAVDCAEDAAPHSSVDSGNDEKTSNNNNNDAEKEPWRAAMLLGKKLFRDPHDVLLGGVIAGVAKYIDVSVPLLRLLVIVGALLLGNIAGGIFALCKVFHNITFHAAPFGIVVGADGGSLQPKRTPHHIRLFLELAAALVVAVSVLEGRLFDGAKGPKTVGVLGGIKGIGAGLKLGRHIMTVLFHPMQLQVAVAVQDNALIGIGLKGLSPKI